MIYKKVPTFPSLIWFFCKLKEKCKYMLMVGCLIFVMHLINVKKINFFGIWPADHSSAGSIGDRLFCSFTCDRDMIYLKKFCFFVCFLLLLVNFKEVKIYQIYEWRKLKAFIISTTSFCFLFIFPCNGFLLLWNFTTKGPEVLSHLFFLQNKELPEVEFLWLEHI